MRISDWSSDVCSSDLIGIEPAAFVGGQQRRVEFVDAAMRLAEKVENGHRYAWRVAAIVMDLEAQRAHHRGRPGIARHPDVTDRAAAADVGQRDAFPPTAYPPGGSFPASRGRSEGSRVVEEWVSQCRSRWWLCP